METKTLSSVILALAFGFIGLVGFSGCGDKGGLQGIKNDSGVAAEFDGAPEWVTSDSGLLAATGSAKIKNNNFGFATTQAEAAARTKLAGQLNTQVESKYRELTTSGEDSVNQEAVQAIRQSVNESLAGSRVVQKWVSKTGNLWVLVKIDKLDTKLLEENLQRAKGVNQAAAKKLAQTVDELLDGEKQKAENAQ
ncbi:LPP20 family lipoprotein [Helicobacter sp. T3_23-1059]